MVFNRANRAPPWDAPHSNTSRYPGALVRDPPIAATLVTRTTSDIDAGRQYSIFETRLGGHLYQVVARLQYDALAPHGFVGACGYTVNLDLGDASFFSEIAAQVSGFGDAGYTPDWAGT